jgi:hypothetical protein
MNQFEKNLQHTLQNESVPGSDSELLWSRIQENRFKRKGSDMRLIRRMAVTASICFAIVVAIGGYGNEIARAASTLFGQVFGSFEEVKQLDPHADQQVMENDLAVAQKVLTENEFKQYTTLIKEQTNIMKKAIEIVGGEQKIYMDRLTEAEKQRLNQNEKQLKPLNNKIDHHFISSVDEAAKKLPFPVKRPEYVPLGYTLEKEEAKSARTTGTQVPVISFSYKQIDGEFGFKIMQSAILTGENDEYSRWKPEQEVTYDLHGNKVYYGKFGKNVTLMKVVVPEKDSTPAYQVFIIADILSKQELEKIALSIIE